MVYGFPGNQPYERIYGLALTDKQELFAATDSCVYVSRDNGNTWNRASTGLPQLPHCAELRFWLEAGIATVTGILFVITLLWRNWIELIFGVDPDQGNGLLEWSIVGILLVATIVLFVLARYEWRKAKTAIA